VQVRFCDELDVGFGWIVDEFMLRCSHALIADGRVWVIDPVDGEGVEDRVRAAGEPAGVIQLLDRHHRDCRAVAERLGVPHHRVPRTPPPGAPFVLIALRTPPFWNEVALWWAEPRLLLCADALGTAPYFRIPGERLGVHPLLRIFPPRQLDGLEPRHVLCGHGEGVHGEDTPQALREALATARRRLPRAWLHAVRGGTRSALR
jgi:hypothetical protein